MLMPLIRTTFLLCFLCLPLNLTFAAAPAITWYSGGEAALQLAPPADDTAPILSLSGTTTLKTLIVTVTAKNGQRHNTPIPLAADGSYNVRYLFRGGIGSYTITLSGSTEPRSLSYRSLCTFTHNVSKSLPAQLLHLELNDKIIAFVSNAMGTTVGRGECWDLAQQALDLNLADWDRPSRFGLPLDPRKDHIKPGDIIQFRSLKTTEKLPGGVTRYTTLGSPDHTAVILKVLGNQRFTLAQQNVEGVRKVTTGDIDLSKVTGGSYWIYRPVAQMIRP